MIDIKQGQHMIPLIACEIPLCQDVCKLILGVDVFDLNLGVKINSIKQPIRSNFVSSGNMSHSGTSAFHNHLKLQLHCPQRHTIKLLGARIGHLKEQHQCLSLHRFYSETCGVCFHYSQVSLIDLKHEKHFQNRNN